MHSNKRISNLRKLMTEKELDAFLITSKTNRYYLSNFTGTYGCVLIDNQSQYIIADGRYFTQLQKQAPDFEIIDDHLMLSETIASVIKVHQYKKIGIESEQMNVNEYLQIVAKSSAKLIPTKDVIEKLRMLKDDSEKKNIEKAIDISDRAFKHIIDYIHPGLTERQVANELDNYGLSLGASSRAFETIVASGYRSALPHGHASDKVINDNEIIVIDFGFNYNHYNSDVTRTIALGKVNSKLRDIYEVVKMAQQTAIDNCVIGKPLREVDSAARNIIAKYGYEKYFLHGLGHGMGLTVHEYPLLNQNSNTTLCARMTFTTEPGIYIAGLGGVRIEDDIYMGKDNKPHRMTKSSRVWIQK